MESLGVCFLTLLLTAIATSGFPTDPPASNPEASDDHLVPRGLPQHHPPPPSPNHPPPAAAVDKPAQPILPRDTSIDGIPCTTDYNCTSSVMGEYSICHGSTCTCATGALQSETSHRCLRESQLGSGCAEDWQCTRPLGDTVSCLNHICTCKPDAEMISGKCWKKKLLTDSCDAAEECLGGRNTLCTDHKCVCKSDMVPKPSNDKCLPEATKYGDPCEEDIQCTESFGTGAKCSKSQCVCQDNYHFKNHVCMQNLKLGSPCGTGYKGDCFLIHDQGINHVSCIDSKCQCTDNRTPSSDGEKCLDPDEKDPGSGGGADSVQPLLLTFITMLLARFLFS